MSYGRASGVALAPGGRGGCGKGRTSRPDGSCASVESKSSDAGTYAV